MPCGVGKTWLACSLGQKAFWFSIGSNYRYLSVVRLPAFARDRDIDFIWRPFNVRAIMFEQNALSWNQDVWLAGEL